MFTRISSLGSSATFAALAVLLAGCVDPSGSAAGPSPVLLTTEGGVSTTRNDPAEIIEATIEDHRLELKVRFGGGCAEHDFALQHSGEFRESYPVQTTLQLFHDANGDNCRALLGRELSFDLTPVRTAYQRAYGAGGVLVLHVREPGGTSAGQVTVRYLF